MVVRQVSFLRSAEIQDGAGSSLSVGFCKDMFLALLHLFKRAFRRHWDFTASRASPRRFWSIYGRGTGAVSGE